MIWSFPLVLILQGPKDRARVEDSYWNIVAITTSSVASTCYHWESSGWYRLWSFCTSYGYLRGCWRGCHWQAHSLFYGMDVPFRFRFFPLMAKNHLISEGWNGKHNSRSLQGCPWCHRFLLPLVLLLHGWSYWENGRRWGPSWHQVCFELPFSIP